MWLFRFELKKIISSKKIIILWIIGLILISTYAFMSDKTDKAIKNSKINIYTTSIEDLNISIISLSNSINAEKNPVIKEAMKESLIYCEETLKLNEQIKQGIINSDNKQILEAQIKILQNQKDEIESGNMSSAISLDEINIEIEKNTYLLTNDLEPINDGMTMNVSNYINLVLKYIAPMLLGIIVVLSTADIVSKEMDYGTMQTLLFQKISKRKIIITKLLACISTNIVFFIITLIIVAIPLYLKNGIGDFNYPSIIKAENTLIITQVSTLILKNLVVTLFFIIFLSCFSTLISIFCKNSIESLCIALTICIGSGILFNKIQLPSWVKIINPFNYLAGNDIFLTGFSSSSITPDTNVILISSVFILYSIAIILLSLVTFSKKQFDIES